MRSLFWDELARRFSWSREKEIETLVDDSTIVIGKLHLIEYNALQVTLERIYMHFGFHFKLFLFFSIILTEWQANANEWDEWKEKKHKNRFVSVIAVPLYEHNERKHTANSNDSIIYRILKQNYPIWGTKTFTNQNYFPHIIFNLKMFYLFTCLVFALEQIFIFISQYIQFISYQTECEIDLAWHMLSISSENGEKCLNLMRIKFAPSSSTLP